MKHRVFVSGCYDMLHSGHVAFFKEASSYGDLYVGIGSDATIMELKGRKTIYSEQERLYMVKSIRYVTDACINTGHGMMDFVESVERFKPDRFVVNSDGSSPVKQQFCAERGIEYIVLERIPEQGLAARSTTALRKTECMLPTRVDLAGTWIDQPYVSKYCPGWAITLSLEPTFPIVERCGLSTSTRNMIKKIWPYQLPDMDPEMLAKLCFCFENEPGRQSHVSGAQDSIGICMPGLVRHYYDNYFWPCRIESCNDPKVLDWLEQHLVMVMLSPRPDGLSVVKGNVFGAEAGGEGPSLPKEQLVPMVRALTVAAADCWDAILAMDLERTAAAYNASFKAQIAMFPGMVTPLVQQAIDKYLPVTLGIKMFGAGGGGCMCLLVADAAAFCASYPESVRLKVRRQNN